MRVAGVEGEHGDGDELDHRAEEAEAEDVVEVLEEVALFQRVPLEWPHKSINQSIKPTPAAREAHSTCRHRR